jgi:hypothetical protein
MRVLVVTMFLFWACALVATAAMLLTGGAP